MILDNPEVGGQSESHLHPVLRGVKIKIKKALQLRRRNAHARIADLDIGLVVFLKSTDFYSPCLLDSLERIFKQIKV
jgi:hypothetical protein